MVRYFTLEYWRDEGWYVGRLKEVPGVFSQGVTLEELEENIQDAYHLMMEEIEESLPHLRIETKEMQVEVWNGRSLSVNWKRLDASSNVMARSMTST